MPIYEYRCGDCNKKFEVFTPQRMNMDGAVCTACHSTNVRRLVSTFASVGGDMDASFSESGESAAGGGCCGGSCGCGCGH
jgi:putative FmdB family regulatory protein